jgi:type I restriction enzyme M protein
VVGYIEEQSSMAIKKSELYSSRFYAAISHSIASRITGLIERCEEPLPDIENEVAIYETKVRSHLERMGFTW